MSTITENSRPQIAFPIPLNAIFYTPQPDGQGGYTDGWATLGDLKKTLEGVWAVLDNVSGANFNATAGGGLQNYGIDTRSGVVNFNLPDTSGFTEPGQQRFFWLPMANSYETFSLFINPFGTDKIMGVNDAVEVNVNGYDLGAIWLNADIGWVLVQGGGNINLTHLNLTANDLESIRQDANDNIILTALDANVLVTSAGNIVDGNIQLPDSASVAPLWSMAFIQTELGKKTFTNDPLATGDSILALDNALQTVGPGALVQVIYLGGGQFFVSGALQ